MKTYFLILFTFYSVQISFAQNDEQEMKTLFGNGRISGGFGAVDMNVSPLRDNLNLFVGGKGAVIFDNHLYLGAAGYGMATQEKFNGIDARLPENNPNSDIRIDMTSFGYGGLLIGYTIAPNSLVHIDIPIVIGAGGVDLSDDLITIQDNDFSLKPSIESSAFFVAQPGINIEINMARFCKMGLGGGYRYIYGTNLININDEDLSGWTANFSLKFGKF